MGINVFPIQDLVWILPSCQSGWPSVRITGVYTEYWTSMVINVFLIQDPVWPYPRITGIYSEWLKIRGKIYFVFRIPSENPHPANLGDLLQRQLGSSVQPKQRPHEVISGGKQVCKFYFREGGDMSITNEIILLPKRTLICFKTVSTFNKLFLVCVN